MNELVFQASVKKILQRKMFNHSKSFWHFIKFKYFLNQIPNYTILSQLGNNSELWDKIFPRSLFYLKTKKKIVSTFRNIEHAALRMGGNMPFFILLYFEESPILPPLLIRDTSLRRSFQEFTTTKKYTSKESVKFCDAEKNLLNFTILISKDEILWEHDFINGEIRIETTFRQIFKKLSYMCFSNCITDIFQVTISINNYK